jgi:hypothetical protein
MDGFMKIQKLTLTLFLATLLPLPSLAAGSIFAQDTVAGVPVTIGVRGVAPGEYDLVIQPAHVPTAGDIIVPIRADDEGSADALLHADEVQIAGSYDVSLERDGKALSEHTRFDVAPGPIDTAASLVDVLDDRLASDGMQQATVSVRAQDRFGNPLSGRPLQLLGSRPSDIITAEADETDDNGEILFSVSTTEDGAIYLRAMDMISGQMFKQSAVIAAGGTSVGNDDRVAQAYRQTSVSGGKTFYYTAQATSPIITKFRMTGASRAKSGNPIPRVTVTALDENNRRVVAYEGTIVCSSTDPEADLPEAYTFLGSEKGSHNFDVNFVLDTPGEQEIRCEDSENSDIAGTLSIDIQGAGGGHGAAGGFRIDKPVSGSSIRELVVQVVGEGELANYVVDGDFVEDGPVTLSSDPLGHFEGEIYLEPDQPSYTLTVYNEQGGTPKTITLQFDNTPPKIKPVTFSPEKPEEGQTVLAVVETEPNVAVRMAFPDGEHEEFTLEESATDGFYNGTFEAPGSGSHQIDVVATDAAGNVSTLRVELEVAGEGLGTVRNLQEVKAPKEKQKAGTALLQWDPVEGATGYLVYHAQKQETDENGNTIYAWEDPLETNRGGVGTPATEAEIAGIPAGAVRYFAVTAIRHEGKETVESAEKSNVVRVQMIGLTLEATPQDSSVALAWSGLSKEIQLSSYLLRYGPSPDDLQESRSIAGKAKSQQVRDLLPGIHYYFELTPITVAGVKMDELSATDDAIVLGGNGFRPAPAEQIPYDIVKRAPQTPAHAGAPLEDTGLPSFAWYALIAGAAFGLLQWHRHRTLKRTMALLEQMRGVKYE